jgi:hypothetical protein
LVVQIQFRGGYKGRGWLEVFGYVTNTPAY